MTRRSIKARQFAEAHFAGCSDHIRQAMAVYQALERLAQRPMLDLHPDAAIGDIFPPSVAPRGEAIDSLDAIEAELAYEAEFQTSHVGGEAVRQYMDRRLTHGLLGPAATFCTWHSSTIRLRSVRGIINERVRHAAGACTCGERSEPPNNRMQRTAPAQAIERRR